MTKEQVIVDIKVPNQTRYLSLIGNIGEDIACILDAFTGDREFLAYQLNLALTEASTNAMEHANSSDPEKFVRVCIRTTDDYIKAEVYDQGQGFDINSLPMTGIDALSDRGRGLLLIRAYMDSVSYQRTSTGNVLRMIKHLK